MMDKLDKVDKVDKLHKAHITAALILLAVTAAAAVFSAPLTDAQTAALCFGGACVLLQPLYLLRGERRSMLYRLPLSYVGVVYISLAAVVEALSLITDSLALIVVCSAVVMAAALAGLISRMDTAYSDPDGTRFISQLTEMTDTISRATAERSCGIATQLLYEKARFCEPCADSSLRELERRILTGICGIHPTDSDDEITHRCEAISALISERERKIL